MKWLWEKRYALISLYAIGSFAVIYLLKLLLDGAVYFLCMVPAFAKGAMRVLAPLIIALVIAYLLDPVVGFFQHAIDKFTAKRPSGFCRKRKKPILYKSQAAGTVLTYLTVFLLIGVIISWLAHKLNLRDDYLSGLSNIMMGRSLYVQIKQT